MRSRWRQAPWRPCACPSACSPSYTAGGAPPTSGAGSPETKRGRFSPPPCLPFSSPRSVEFALERERPGARQSGRVAGGTRRCRVVVRREIVELVGDVQDL